MRAINLRASSKGQAFEDSAAARRACADMKPPQIGLVAKIADARALGAGTLIEDWRFGQRTTSAGSEFCEGERLGAQLLCGVFGNRDPSIKPPVGVGLPAKEQTCPTRNRLAEKQNICKACFAAHY